MKKSLKPLLWLSILVSTPLLVTANPEGEHVRAGSATIHRNGPGSMTINQGSDKVIIDWTSFSIGSGEITRFIQPGANAAALNRVTGGNPTSIYGMLQGNGRIYVINPSGILVGRGGVINTHSFSGSTLDVSDAAFLSGVGMRFSGSSTASVRNEGTINALGGDIFLFAHTVENAGSLNAPSGTVGLAAGSEVLLRQSGNERVSVLAGNVNTPQSAIGVDNAGAVQAANAELKAAGGNIYALAINNGGIIRADTLVNQGGRVLLKANGGNIQNTGTLEASGPNGNGGAITVDGGHNSAAPATVTSSGTIDAHGASGKGGRVKMVGDNVGLFDESLIDVSGATGGGTALIGGDVHGSNPNVQNAEKTFVDANSRINADAVNSGNGGKVVIWSDQVTRFAGDVSAQGAGSRGSGGFAEISGKQDLMFQGTSSLLGGAHGNAGLLLLDPKNITIASGGSTITADSAFTDTPAGSSTFSPSSLITLLGGQNVLLQANNDISFQNDVNASAASHDLRLEAGRSILFGNNVNLSLGGALNATFNDGNAIAANRDPGAAAFTMNSGSTIAAAGGVLIQAGTLAADSTGPTSIAANTGNIGITDIRSTISGVAGANAGTITILDNQAAGKNITISGAINASGNNNSGSGGGKDGGNGNSVVINGSGAVTLANVDSSGGASSGSSGNGGNGGSVQVTAGGALSISSTLNSSGADGSTSGTGGNGGLISLSSGSTLAYSAAITSSGGNAAGTAASGNAGAISISDGSGLLTIGDNISAVGGNVSTPGSGGAITINADDMAITANINSGNARTILAPFAAGVAISLGAPVAGQLSLLNTELGHVTASILQIGNGNAGNISIVGNISAPAGWNTLALQTVGSIGQTAGNTLSVANLALRAGTTVNLPEANAVATLSGQSAGNFLYNDTDGLTVGSVDGLNGIAAGPGSVTLTAGAALALNNNVSGVGASFTGVGVTQNGSSTVNAGSGDILVDANDGAINMNGALTTSSASGTAVVIRDATSAALGNISAANGTVVLGQAAGDNLSGNVSQNSSTAIAANTLSVNSGGSVNLGNANALGNLAAITTGGALTVHDVGGGLNVNGPITGTAGNPVSITTSGGDLAINDNVNGTVVTLTDSGDNNRLSILAGKTVTATAGATLTADRMDIGGTIASAGNRVTLRSSTAGRNITLGSDDVSGATSGPGTLGLTATELNNITADTLKIGAANSGNIVLDSGAPGINPAANTLSLESGSGILQTAGSTITVQNLALRAAGPIALGEFNKVNNLAASVSGAGQNFLFNNAVNLAIATGIDGLNGITANNGNISVATGNGTLTVASSVDAGSTGGSVSLTAGSSGVDNALTLNPGVTVHGLNGVTLVADNIGIDSTASIDAGASSVTLRQFENGTLIDLGGADAAGTLGLANAELARITAGIVRIGDANSGNINLSSSITAPATWNALSLQTAGTINQAGGANLTVPSLAIRSVGSVNLSGDVNTLAAVVSGTGNSFRFTDPSGLTVGTVDSLAGIATTGAGGNDVILSTGGTLNIGDGSGQSIFAPNAIITLNASSGGVTENAGSTVQGAVLTLRGSGNFNLGNAGNNVIVIAGAVNGPVTYTDADGFTTGSGNDAFGLVTGLSSGNNAITLTADLIDLPFLVNSGSARTILQTLTAGRIIDIGTKVAGELGLDATDLANITAGTLQIGNASAGAINLSATVTLGSSTLALINNGAIGGGGAIIVPNLRISSAGPVTFTGLNNVNNLAVALSGSANGLIFNDINGLNIGTVDGVTGISSLNGPINLTLGGSLTLNGAVNAGSGVVTVTAITPGSSVTGPGLITAGGLSIDTDSGIGSLLASLNTAVSSLEARTVSGGIFVHNTGNLAIGGVSSVNGLRVTGSGVIQLVNDGSVSVLLNGDTVSAPGNVSIQANGVGSDISTSGSDGYPLAAIRSVSGDVSLNAGRDIVLGQPIGNWGNVQAGHSLFLTAGRDFIATQDSWVNAHGAGTVTINSGRNVFFQDTSLVGSEGGTISINTGAGGAFSIAGPNGINTHFLNVGLGGDILINAGTMVLNAPLNAGIGNITLNNSGLASGSGLLTANILNLAGAGDVGALGARINTAVSTVNFAKAGGDSFINEADAVNLQGATGNGNLDLVAGGGITLAGLLNLGSGDGALQGTTIDLAGFNLVGANITLNNSALATSGGGRINAGTLTLQGAGDVGSGASRFNTTVNNIVLAKSGGSAFVNELDAVNVQGTTGNGNFDLLAGNGITLNGALNAGAGNAALQGTTIDLAGFNLTAGNVTLNNSALASSSGGTVNAGTLTFQGEGDVGSAGSRFNTAVNNIVFAKAGGNSFVNESDAVNLQGTTGNGDLNVLAGAGIGLSGALSAGSGNTVLQGTTIDLAGFDLTAANVTLNNSALATSGGGRVNAATLTLQGAGDVGSGVSRFNTTVNSIVFAKSGGNSFVNEADAVSIQGTTGNGSLDLLAGAGISLGALLDAGTGNATLQGTTIDLAGFDLNAAGVTLNNSGLATSGGGRVNAATLTLQGAGDVGSGVSRFNTTVNNIVFAKAGGNSFINEQDGLIIQGTTGNGSLDLLAGAGISLNGALNAGAGNAALQGTTIDLAGFDLTAANVTLNNSGLASSGGGHLNAGTLTLQGAGDVGSVGSRFNTAVNTIVLNKTSGNTFVRETDAVNIQGQAPALDLVAGGAIGQSGSIDITGAAVFKTLNDAGAGVNLDRVGDTVNNSFGSISVQVRNSADTANAAGDIVLHENDGDGTQIASVQTGGGLSLVSDGPITQSGAVVVGGLASFNSTGSGANGNITLNGGGNNFGSLGLNSANGAAVSVTESSDTLLDNVAVNNGSLTINSAGAIGQVVGKSLVVSGLASFTSTGSGAAGNIALNQAGNSFGSVGLVSANGAAVSVVESGDTALDTVTVNNGTLAVTSSGTVSQVAGKAVTVSGLASFTATSTSDVLLDNANNDFASITVPVGRNVTIHDRNGFNLGGVHAFETLTLNTEPGSGDVVQLLDGSIVDARTLSGTLGGGLILGNPANLATTAQPQNRLQNIGTLTHHGQVYVYDSDSTSYSAAGVANPVPANNTATLGLIVNGNVSGSGTTVIRTAGDLVLEAQITSENGTRNANDITLSAENSGNFHNLFGADAVKAGTGSRFLIFSTDAKQNFGEAFSGGRVTFNGLGTVGPGGPGFLADSPSPTFNNHPSPIIEQNGRVDDGTQNGFVFVKKQTITQNNETAKFFLDVLNLAVYSGVNAVAEASNLPPERPPTIWTSSYHIYLDEQKQKEEEKKKRKHRKALAEQLDPLWDASLGG